MIATSPNAATVANAEQMNIVIGGHVDHGKSTIIGRLLADTDSLPHGKLDAVRALCERNSKPFEYAFLLDALKDEMAQGITIDAARVFFKTRQRDYIIIDAPGHIEFLKNMVTGASRAEAALLVIDAEEGVRENSRRHGYLMSMLGIRQIAVLVNKMDLVQYDQAVYDAIVAEYRAFLAEIGVEAHAFLPVSGREGDNIASCSARMAWYDGPTVIGTLDGFAKEKPASDKPLRLPVQDVYKFTAEGDKRRLVAGTIETGTLHPGDTVVFYPSAKKSRVATIESFNRPPLESAEVGQAIAFTLDEQIYITRGELAARADEPEPRVTTRLQVSLFWMGRTPLTPDRDYLLKIGTARTVARLEKVLRVIDASNLESSTEKTQVERHDVAECVFKCNHAIAFDLAADSAPTSRFVIVDEYEIRGGGIVREALEDDQEWVRSHVQMRNLKWETSFLSREQRSEKYNQRATLILITGERHAGKKVLAKALEARLFDDGKIVYFLGIGNVLYGVDADIKVPGDTAHKQEHLRRLAEVAHLLLDAGVLLVVTAVGLTAGDLELIETTVGAEKALVVWLGEEVTTDVRYDLRLPRETLPAESVNAIKSLLQDRGVIFRPY